MTTVIWDCVRPLAPKSKGDPTLPLTKGTLVMNLSGHNVQQKGVGLTVGPGG